MPKITTAKLLTITARDQRILKALYYYRFMSAMDVTRLLYSQGSLEWVRARLSQLAGGDDYSTGQYLYRLPLLDGSRGNQERIFTIGSRGRDFLANELGLPVTWHYRPSKVKHASYAQILLSLLLTRFLVASVNWTENNPDYKILEMYTSYELGAESKNKRVLPAGRQVIPDAWILFGNKGARLALIFELDRGREYQKKFKEHVRSRVHMIRSGEYEKWFGVPGAIIAYATTGETPEYR